MSDNRDQLLAIGAQCSEATCHLVDFLPFKCQHCNLRYCGDHFKPDAHRCSKYDESKVNRVAPACPLCNTPVAIPPEQDPNIRMERHIQSECSVMTGQAPRKSSPVCGRPKCGKVLFAPITCDKCRKQFCPSHRFPATHNCASTASSAQSKPSSSRSPPIPNMSKALEDLPARTNAALSAVKRSMANQSTPTVNSPRVAAPAVKQASSESSSKSGPGGMRNPFSQVDRLAASASNLSVSASNNGSNTAPGDDANRTDNSDTVSRKSTQSQWNPMSFLPPPVFARA